MGKIMGVDERYYPAENGQEIGTFVVLVGGDIGDYVAYIGHGSPEWVRKNGDKISYEEACCHFPGQLKAEKYRS